VLFDCGQAIASYLNITPENPTLHFPHLFVIVKTGTIRRDLEADDINADAITAVVDAALK